MTETIEQKCIAKGVKLTEQRRLIAKVMSELMIILMLMSYIQEYQKLTQKLALLQYTEQ